MFNHRLIQNAIKSRWCYKRTFILLSSELQQQGLQSIRDVGLHQVLLHQCPLLFHTLNIFIHSRKQINVFLLMIWPLNPPESTIVFRIYFSDHNLVVKMYHNSLYDKRFKRYDWPKIQDGRHWPSWIIKYGVWFWTMFSFFLYLSPTDAVLWDG